ncbi:MAG: hypothetical protein ACI4TF_09560 [Oliverpabstia sp.]
MRIEQFVMAYKVEQDRIRALLPEGFSSLRPVIRINTEIRSSEEDEQLYVEVNTPVEAEGKRGWLNIGHWDNQDSDVTYKKEGKTITISSSFLKLTYTCAGTWGGCPAEKDNEGCFYISEGKTEFIPAKEIKENREFCDCEFEWLFSANDAKGKSVGMTLPAFKEESRFNYEKKSFVPENVAEIPCERVLGSYIVRFAI